MRTIDLILASLVIATVWGENPLVMFAQVEGTLVPLSSEPLEKAFSDVRVLAYGNSSDKPVEFTQRDNFLSTHSKSMPGLLGFLGSTVAFGYYISPNKWKFDSEKKVLGGPYYSCDIFDNNVHAIMHRGKGILFEGCFEVNLYFLPYDRKTKSAVRKLDQSEKHSKHPPAFDEKKKSAPKKPQKHKMEKMHSSMVDDIIQKLRENLYSSEVENIPNGHWKICARGKWNLSASERW